MAKEPELSPDSLLCTTCNRLVVPSTEKKNKGELVHHNTNIKDHEVIKSITYGDLQARLIKARTIPGRKTPKKGTGDKRVGGPGRAALPDDKVKPKSLKRREQRAAQRKMTPEERQKVLDTRRGAAEASKAAAEATLPDLYYHETKGLHYPKASSTTPVVNPKTREIVVPKTGQVMGTYRGIIATDTASPSEIAGKEHIDSHPEHKWETATDIRSIETTGSPTDLIGPGLNPEAQRAPNNAFYGQMVDWARDHKANFDMADRYEYTVVKPTLPVPQEKNPVFTRQDAETNPGSWIVKRRLKYCADCSPTVLDNYKNKTVRNRAQTVTRPEPLELPSVTSNDPPNGILRERAKLGLTNKYSENTRPAAPRGVRGASFDQGSGEGKAAGAD